MLILQNPREGVKNYEPCLAAVFGVGLIGTYLVRNLIKSQFTITHNLPFSWQNPRQRKIERPDILSYIQNLIKTANHDDRPCRGGVYPRPHDFQNPAQGCGQLRGGLTILPNRAGLNPAPTELDWSEQRQIKFIFPDNTPDKTHYKKELSCRIDFVWSAGKGGFGLKEVDTVPELEAFAEVVEMAMTLLRKNPSCMVRFHMVSSAGGLFEGQRNVNTATLPDPKRPYGLLKLAQEKILDDCDELVRFVYRPTSVYGFAGLHRRLGLIPTLLWNGARNKVCTIFGAPETLRDYVWSDDVGSFIAERIQSPGNDSTCFTLASGKPSMLFEVSNHVEKLLNKKLFRHYIKTGGNAEHNTFSIATHPDGWRPLDLTTGIRKTRFAMIANSR